MKKIVIYSLFAMLLFSSFQKKVKVEYNIVDYGAVSDTMKVNTISIQKTIDQCAANGGGKVIVPKGKFVTGTLFLKSNVEFHVEKGGEVLGSIFLKDYSKEVQGAIEAPAFDECLLYAENATNIKITGKGIINGRGTKRNFPEKLADKSLGDRPMLIRFVNCKDVIFKDIELKNAASWCTHMVNSDNLLFKNIKIDSRVNINNDGLDIDGCKNVRIEGCTIFTGDDSICPKSTTTRFTENIVVKNCRVNSHTSAFKCGTSSRGGFKNITVKNCDFSGTRMGAIKLMIVDGGTLDNIRISNIKAYDVEGPIFIRLGNRGRSYEKPTEQVYESKVASEGMTTGVVKNIHISNIKATVVSEKLERCGIFISGIPEHPVENVVLENISISYPGGGTLVDSKREVPEDIARYPEQFFFGKLPSWGAYIRHAKNIEFKNVKMTTLEDDKREKIVVVDVINYTNK